ncbi:short transient receptor potential channel 4-like isoform X3 [Pocillopora verrucosa]|uniref:short transient receptor potential channel 4-like isoform X3 n=1 Tax=Pocillopora verrucosa TaxID=203993 RepID=UPI00333F59FF
MSEGNTYNLLNSPASNGDNVEEGLNNHGVENDANLPTTSETIKTDAIPQVLLAPKAFYGSQGSLSSFKVDFPKERRESQKMDSIKDFLKEGEKFDWEDIKKVVTASALCDEEDPIDKAFKVHMKLCQIAKTSTENTKAIEKLADRVDEFAYDLLDQVKRIEEKELHDEVADRYASLFSEMTAKAIARGRKKFVSHPFIFKRVEKRWKLGLSEDFQSRLPHRFLLLLIMMLDAILTPVMLPLNAYVASKNQQGTNLTNIQGIYAKYLETPYVIFMKTQFMQLTFIGLFFRISMIGSSIAPTVEESFILLFFIGFVVSEIQQYRSSASKVYLRDIWNYLDVLIMLVYAFVITIRIATVIIGGDPYKNRLLELANYGYGFDGMLLILRFSSILELSSVIGPLQLALFRMCLDLLVILIQFCFVIAAFSLAITKCYTAETSFLTPLNSGSNNVEYCVEGSLNCFFKSARQLVWSVFGMTHFEEMESITSLTSDIVVFLYLVFLVLSVIMLVNILVALLTTTYDKYKTNAEMEWKFSRAVIEEQYRRMHLVVVPFNIISEPLKALYFAQFPDNLAKRKDQRNEKYKKFLKKKFFPEITERYRRKYDESFPSTGNRKLDKLGENLNFVRNDLEEMKNQRMTNLERKLERVIEQLQRISQGDPTLSKFSQEKENKGRSKKRVSFVEEDEEASPSSSANRKLSTSMAEVQIHLPQGEQVQAQEETENHITGTSQMQNFSQDDGQDSHL